MQSSDYTTSQKPQGYAIQSDKDFCCLKLLSKGRIGRTQYFLWTSGISLLGILLAVLLSLVPTVGTSLAFIYLTGMVCFNLLLTIQRCHDMNKSGWLCLAALIPPVSFLFYLIPGTIDRNRYGLKPKACCSEAKVGAFLLASVLMLSFIIGVSFYETTPTLEHSNLIAALK